jgi:DNA invertase Pin-like site-specific DNA recombinase
MLKDAKAKLFDCLLVNDLSRLSRDTIETAQVCRRLVYWRIRLVTTDGIDTAHDGWEELAGIRGVINHQYNKALAKNIKRGMVGQAEKCFWNGGRVYGYRLAEICHEMKLNQFGKPLRIGSRLEIDPDQAKWVKWIFEAYADGRSPRNIVTELNARGVPPPGAAYKRKNRHRPPTWNAAALHGELERGTGLLNNQLYRGLYRWNRSYRVTDPDEGTKTNHWREKQEWVTKEMPELRIISDDLWERAHGKRVAVSQSAQALNTARALKLGHDCRSAGTGRRPKYPFSGLLICGKCGGNMSIYGDPGYACSLWRMGGDTDNTCTNSLTVKRAVVESQLMHAIRGRLFTEEGLEIFKHEFEQYLIDERKAKSSDKAQTQARLAKAEQEIAHITAAIRAGIITPTTKAMLMEAEAEREKLKQTLQLPTAKL